MARILVALLLVGGIVVGTTTSTSAGSDRLDADRHLQAGIDALVAREAGRPAPSS